MRTKRNRALATAFLVVAFGISPVRGEDGTDFPPPFTEKVVYSDPEYEFVSGHLQNGEKMVAYFAARGFAIRNATELAAWMKAKVAGKKAYGTVGFLATGVAPETILWEGMGVKLCGKERLISEYIRAGRPTLLRQYLEAGGRLVWPGLGVLSFCQGEEGGIAQLPRHAAEQWLADVKVHPIWYGWELKPRVGAFSTPPTEAGNRWGLKGSYLIEKPFLAETVTEAFSEDREFKVANFFLKTLNRNYPGSGIIGLPTAVDGNNPEQMADFYRLTLYRGTPVEVPVVPEPAPARTPCTIALSAMDGRKHLRSAFVRTEEVRLLAKVTSSVDAAFSGQVRLSVTDAGSNAVLRAEQPLAIKANASGDVDARWATVDSAVGEYRFVAFVADSAGREVAESAVSLFLCPRPRQTGVFVGPVMHFAKHPVRCRREVQHLGEAGLSCQVPEYTDELSDLLLRHQVPFQLRLECGGIPFNPSLPQRLGARGEGFCFGKPQADPLSAPVVAAIGASLEKQVAACAGHPALLPYAVGFDDWGAVVGWNWAPHVSKKFRESTGLEAPVPAVIAATRPRYSYHKDFHVGFGEPKGLVDPRHPWLLWNQFIADQVGEGAAGFVRHVRQAMPGLHVGWIPGFIYFWPLNGAYAPRNFGGAGQMDLLSYYAYLFGSEPQLRHLYWIELGRAGNRDLPALVMPEMYSSISEIPAFYRLTLFAGLAGGARFIDCFRWVEAPPEAKYEMLRLGKELAPHMELFGALKPAPKSVGLLVPYSNTVFDPDYALWHCATVFENLLCAHFEVEPVVEEEVLSGDVTPQRYEAMILSDVDWLRKDVAQKLARYAAAGGRILSDRMTEVDIAGAHRLKEDLVFGVAEAQTREQATYGTPQWVDSSGKDVNMRGFSCRTFPATGAKPYGDAALLKRLRVALGPWATPRFRCSADNLVIRRFTAEGADYLWVINVEDAAEHELLRRADGANAWPATIAAMQKRTAGVFRTTLVLPEGKFTPYDVLAGKQLPCRQVDKGVEVPVEMERFGGTLLALLDREITGLTIHGPPTIRKCQDATFAIRIDGPTNGCLPVEVAVTDAQGRAAREYSSVYLARRGQAEVRLRPAANDVPGRWRLRVREILGGKEYSHEFQLQEANPR